MRKWIVGIVLALVAGLGYYMFGAGSNEEAAKGGAPGAAKGGPPGAFAQPPVPPGCVQSPNPLPGGALALYCVPPAWNGQLVVFAPGYTPPYLPKGFYQLTTPDGTASLPQLVMSLGYAFATTSAPTTCSPTRTLAVPMPPLVANRRPAIFSPRQG